MSPTNSVHRCCKPQAAPPAPWAQKSGSALGGHIGPAAPSRRSTEARGPNTSCHRTPVARADTREEIGKVGLWAVCTGAWNPGTGGLCREQKGRQKEKRFCAGTALVKREARGGGSWQSLGTAEGDAGMLPQVTSYTTHLGRARPPSPSARACPCSTHPAGPGRATWYPPA